MPTWQYREIRLSELPPKANEVDILNHAGEDGWELVGITVNNIAYLKRQAPTTPSAKSPRKSTTPPPPPT
jgi:hypothetical protein